MASTDLHKLVVKLEAESSKLHSALEKSDNRLKRFEKKAGTALKKVERHFSSLDKTVKMFSGGLAGIASGAALGGLAMLTTKSLETADAIDKATRRTNLSAKAYQELSFVASQSSISQETFSMAMQRFTRRTAEAARGSGEAKGALEQLGIQLTDNEGKIRTSDALLSDVADALKNVEDPAERVRLSFKLFDSEGVKMVNMLANGSAGMNSLREEANRLGLVLDDQIIANAVTASDELDKVSKIAGVHLTRAMLDLAPALITAARGFSILTKYAGESLDKFRSLENRTLLEPLREEMNDLLDARLKISKRLSKKGILSWFTSDSDKKALVAIEARINKINERMLEIQKQRNPAPNVPDNVIDLPKLGTGGNQEAIDKFGSSIKTDAEVIDFFSAKVAILNEKFNNGTMSVARYAAEIEKLKPSLKGIGADDEDQSDNFRSKLDGRLEQIRSYNYSKEEALAAAYSIEAEQAAIAFEDEAMRKEALLALEEKYQRDKAKLAAEGAYDLEKIQKRLTQSLISLEASRTNGALQLMNALGQKSKTFAIAAFIAEKAIAVKRIIIQTNVAAAAALTPPPIGLGPVSGMALAAKIKAAGTASAVLTGAASIVEGINKFSNDSGSQVSSQIAANDPIQNVQISTTSSPAETGNVTYVERPEYVQNAAMSSEVFEWYVDALEDAIEKGDRVIFTRNSAQGMELQTAAQ